MKIITIKVSDDATNFDVFEAVFGFSSLFNVDNGDKKELMDCRFEEDDTHAIKENRLSKTWGNSKFELSDWVKTHKSAILVECKDK